MVCHAHTLAVVLLWLAAVTARQGLGLVLCCCVCNWHARCYVEVLGQVCA